MKLPHPSPSAEVASVETDAASAPNPLYLIHRLLCERYRYAIPLGIVLAIGLAVGTYTSIEPEYQSIGKIRVDPSSDAVMYDEIRSHIDMFDSFLDYQVDLIQSQRVVDLAMRNSAWTRVSGKSDVRGMTDFFNQLSVSSDGQLIAVAFTDHDPIVAQAAVKSVVDSYMAIYGEHDRKTQVETLGLLEVRRTSLNNQIRAVRQQVIQVANEFGTDDLDRLYENKQVELFRLEAMHREAQRRLQAADLPRGGGDNEAAVYWTAEEIASVDPTMAQLLAEREALRTRLRQMESRFGDNHRQVRTLRAELGVSDQIVASRREAYNDGSLELAATASSTDGQGGGVGNVVQLRSVERSLRDTLDQHREELMNLGRKRLQIDELKKTLATNIKYLQETETRIEKINVESARADRIKVSTEAEMPLGPENWKKRVQFSAVSGMAGFGASFALFILIGFLDRRLRNFNDAKSSLGSDAFLGLLPQLPEDFSDPQQALVASLSVHEIRSMLQSGRTGDEGLTIGVTSATAGAGKTSLTLAMGLSFAATGLKTLVVDFDFVGCGLSSRVRKIERQHVVRELEKNQQVDRQQLQQAMQVAQREGRSLQAVAIEMGLIQRKDLIDLGIAPEGHGMGVFEVINNTPLMQCVAPTGIENFQVLSVGNAQISDIGTLSHKAVRRLVSEASEHFDVIIFDTGPMLGSLEAAIVCAQVDEAVLVLSRGEHQRYAQASVDRLVEVGARVAGLVFNKADGRDVERFNSTSSLSSRMSQPDSGEMIVNLRDAEDCPTEYGPIAHATAACLSEVAGKGDVERRAS